VNVAPPSQLNIELTPRIETLCRKKAAVSNVTGSKKKVRTSACRVPDVLILTPPLKTALPTTESVDENDALPYTFRVLDCSRYTSERKRAGRPTVIVPPDNTERPDKNDMKADDSIGAWKVVGTDMFTEPPPSAENPCRNFEDEISVTRSTNETVESHEIGADDEKIIGDDTYVGDRIESELPRTSTLPRRIDSPRTSKLPFRRDGR
jgi:hypothetical protein